MKTGYMGRILGLLIVLGLGVGVGARAEDFKGPPPVEKGTIGFLSGLGLIDTTPGVALILAPALRVINQGFVSDISNAVYFETQLGTILAKGAAAFSYGGYLRWDFDKDDNWTLYALGGVGGNITGSKLNDRFAIFPRFAIGTFYRLESGLAVRAELSHELIMAGVSLGF